MEEGQRKAAVGVGVKGKEGSVNSNSRNSSPELEMKRECDS